MEELEWAVYNLSLFHSFSRTLSFWNGEWKNKKKKIMKSSLASGRRTWWSCREGVNRGREHSGVSPLALAISRVLHWCQPARPSIAQTISYKRVVNYLPRCAHGHTSFSTIHFSPLKPFSLSLYFISFLFIFAHRSLFLRLLFLCHSPLRPPHRYSNPLYVATC